MSYSQASSDRLSGKNIYYLHYTFQALSKGSYVIPELTFKSHAGDIKADKITINVYPKEALSKKSVDVAGNDMTYYTLTKSAKNTLFPNETTPIEHKIYLTSQLNIALWGLPLGDKENCSAWRFSTPNNRAQISRARIDGNNYQAGSFHTNLTTLKQGKASIGPLKSRVVFHAAVMTNRGLTNQQFEIHLNSDQLALNVKPLPDNQPEHFRGDVGNYVMSASIDSPAEILENDSIRIITQLKGTGNLATVNAPLLLDLKGWKVISESRTDLGKNRKSPKGIAEFSYLLQPTKLKAPQPHTTQTPSLLFVTLDPNTAKYKSSRIPGKPITINPPKSSHQQDAKLPYDSLIPSPKIDAYTHPWYRNLPIWLIYILPLGFILTIICKQLRNKIHTQKLANTERDLKRQTLAELEKVDTLFLKSAGAYVERWIDTEKHPKAREILSLRDSLCFRPESRQDVSAERRKKIIALLRKSSLLILFCLFMQDSFAQKEKTLQQGEIHFQQKNYLAAIASFESLPNSSDNPHILYNIGLCHQLKGNDGIAALHYHQALQINDTHPSALKNLNYIETENSCITKATLTDLESWTSYFTPSTYLHFTLFLIALTLCIILTFIYIKPRATTFRITVMLSIFTPILLSLTTYAYLSHPYKSTYQLQNAVILETTTLTSQPLKSSQHVIEAAPASHCHLIAQRGIYSYIMMPNGVKGWVTSERIKTY